MAEVDLEIGGRRYAVACRDGDEARFMRLATIIDDKMKQATGAVGGLNETRQFLFASLLLADELDDARKNGPAVATAPSPAPAAADSAVIAAIERIAERLETLADRVDSGVESARATS
jgi:cell division protein ZapA